MVGLLYTGFYVNLETNVLKTIYLLLQHLWHLLLSHPSTAALSERESIIVYHYGLDPGRFPRNQVLFAQSRK